jgi:hypothetical protein
MEMPGLRECIERSDGYCLFSDNAVTTDTLLAMAYDTLDAYGITDARHGSGGLKRAILACFASNNGQSSTTGLALASSSLYQSLMSRKCSIIHYDDRTGTAGLNPEDVWHSCKIYFESIAPKWYRFGAHKELSNLYGWFREFERGNGNFKQIESNPVEVHDWVNSISPSYLLIGDMHKDVLFTELIIAEYGMQTDGTLTIVKELNFREMLIAKSTVYCTADNETTPVYEWYAYKADFLKYAFGLYVDYHQALLNGEVGLIAGTPSKDR